MPDQPFVLEMLGISKSFPGVQALTDVSLQLRPAEIHAVVGENGAGKSTLMKILSGAYTRDAGRILLQGQEVHLSSPDQALQRGIATIYQESNLSPELSVAENIFMGRLPHVARIFVNWPRLYQLAQPLLDQLGTTFDARTPVKALSPAQRQMTEIAKALSMSAKVIVMDEPSASLTGSEVDVLMAVMRRLRDQGVTIVFISHRLEEVFKIADRVTVLRDGQWVSTAPISETNPNTLVSQMVGRQIVNLYEKDEMAVGKSLLRVRDVSGQGFHNISFEVHESEVVGMFGLVGSGRTEVARTLFGADRLKEGSVELERQALHLQSPRGAINAGIALAPEDRKSQGLVLGMSVRSNITLPILNLLRRLVFLRFSKEKELAEEYKDRLDIRTPSLETTARSLSGGNQQKVVIAKWLATRPKVLILDEPTRGIDIAGKAEVHKLVNLLAAQGVGILFISSELPEILGMSDRILVMHEGQLAGELDRDSATEESVMRLASGQVGHEQTGED
jgi:ABC-type sugar transport system ATPase subunit